MKNLFTRISNIIFHVMSIVMDSTMSCPCHKSIANKWNQSHWNFSSVIDTRMQKSYDRASCRNPHVSQHTRETVLHCTFVWWRRICWCTSSSRQTAKSNSTSGSQMRSDGQLADEHARSLALFSEIWQREIGSFFTPSRAQRFWRRLISASAVAFVRHRRRRRAPFSLHFKQKARGECAQEKQFFHASIKRRPVLWRRQKTSRAPVVAVAANNALFVLGEFAWTT